MPHVVQPKRLCAACGRGFKPTPRMTRLCHPCWNGGVRHAYLLGRYPGTHLRGVFLGRSERFFPPSDLRFNAPICYSAFLCGGQHGEKTERGEASRISGAPPGPRSSKADSRCARKAEIAPGGASSRRGRSVASLRPSGPVELKDTFERIEREQGLSISDQVSVYVKAGFLVTQSALGLAAGRGDEQARPFDVQAALATIGQRISKPEKEVPLS